MLSQILAIDEAGGPVPGNVDQRLYCTTAQALPRPQLRSDAWQSPSSTSSSIYDHGAGHLVEVKEFGVEAKKALAQYELLEAQYRGDHKMDIVLVGSDSLDTVRITHANYFDAGDSWKQVEAYLRGVSDRHRV